MNKRLAIVLTAAMLASVIAIPVSASAEDLPVKSISAEQEREQEQERDGAASEASEPSEPSDAALSKADAERLIRQYVSIPDEYKLQSSSFSTDKLVKGVRSTWRLEFVRTANGRQTGRISASIDASSGQLYSFGSYSYQPAAAPVYPLKVDRTAAKELAESFLKDLAPSYRSNVKLNETFGVPLLPPLSGEVRHTLRYDRIENGILYPENYIQIELNSEGHVLDFRLAWDETIEFPKASSLLTLEEASEAIAKHAKPRLAYIVPYGAKGTLQPVLSYELPMFVVDAATGELKNERYSYDDTDRLSESPISDKPLSVKPKGGSLTESQAIEAVEKAFGLPENSALSSSGLHESEGQFGEEIRSWSLDWEITENGKAIGSISAGVDGSTGAIQYYYKYYYDRSQATGSVTLEQAVDKAVDTVKRQLPWLTDKLYIYEPRIEDYGNRKPEEIGSYYITFRHKVHGALVESDYVSVSINARSGEVENFSAQLAPFDYPATAPKTIGRDGSLEKWMEYYSLQLNYRLSVEYWRDGAPIPMEKYNLLVASGEVLQSDVESKASVELVYRLVPTPTEETVFLDARSGEWRSRSTGEAIDLIRAEATDIEGHWAEHSLKLMVAYRALDLTDGEVRPNAAITRGELIKMLVLARSGGQTMFAAMDNANSSAKQMASFRDVAADSDLFAYVESALQQNLIDLGDGSFNPDAKVSRDEMAELIVRALGYNSLANYDYIFRLDFKDAADIEHKGQAAIAVGLKIMSLSDGKFLPNKQVTRAEASIAFYRYLQKRAELQETPLRM